MGRHVTTKDKGAPGASKATGRGGPHPMLIELAKVLARRAAERDYEALLKSRARPADHDGGTKDSG